MSDRTTNTEQAIRSFQEKITPYLSKVKVPGNPQTGQVDLGYIAHMAYQLQVLDIAAKLNEVKVGATISHMLQFPPEPSATIAQREDYLCDLDTIVARAVTEFSDDVLKEYAKASSSLVLPSGAKPKVDLSQISLK